MIGAPATLIMVVFVVGFLLPLKILVAFIQAFIFCKLAMLYIAGALEEAEHAGITDLTHHKTRRTAVRRILTVA